jgi:hypothetical protein
MLLGRVLEMANILQENRSLLVKLSATSMSLSLAAAKLYSYKMQILSECEKDKKFLEDLALAYKESAEIDYITAEEFNSLSYEVDQLLIGMDF